MNFRSRDKEPITRRRQSYNIIKVVDLQLKSGLFFCTCHFIMYLLFTGQCRAVSRVHHYSLHYLQPDLCSSYYMQIGLHYVPAEWEPSLGERGALAEPSKTFLHLLPFVCVNVNCRSQVVSSERGE